MTHKGKCKYLAVVFGYIFFSLSIHQGNIRSKQT